MSMEMMKKVLVGAIGVAIYSFSGSAQADCGSTTADQWECLEAETSAGSGTYDDLTSASVASGPYTFAGVSSLSYSVFGIEVLQANCLVTLEGEVDVDPSGNRTYIDVTSGTVVPDPNDPDSECNNISLSGFPWEAVDPGTNNSGIGGANGGDVHTPSTGVAVGDIINLSVDHSNFGSGICTGRVQDVEFRNHDGSNDVTDPSAFTFASDVGNCNITGVVSTDGYTDVNAW